MPVLLYGLEACPLTNSIINSLDFIINHFFMKHFKTNDMNIIKCVQRKFNFEQPSTTLAQHDKKFVVKFL